MTTPTPTKPHVHGTGGQYLAGCPGCKSANQRRQSTPGGREAARAAYQRRRSSPEGREAYRATSRAVHARRRARTPEQADADFLTKWPEGRACVGCGEVLPAEAYARDFTTVDGRARRCDRNGCRSRHRRMKQLAKLAEVWAARGLPTDTCGYCLAAPIEHVDHFHPSSKGGPDNPDNYVGACPGCNLSKSDRDPFEWLAATHPDRTDFFRALFPKETP